MPVNSQNPPGMITDSYYGDSLIFPENPYAPAEAYVIGVDELPGYRYFVSQNFIRRRFNR
ncbi:MAG TPA: hypothetical protein PKV75_10950 [Desulfobacterales bacterium]|nr:hypothetical protein [Desulfobacterales bacterium]